MGFGFAEGVAAGVVERNGGFGRLGLLGEGSAEVVYALWVEMVERDGGSGSGRVSPWFLVICCRERRGWWWARHDAGEGVDVEDMTI